MNRLALSAVLATSLLGSGCDSVDSEAEARIAYLGVDNIVSKALALGFAGFNAASSANIPPQSDNGDEEGTITASGQVDQGASDNKGMRLDIALADYDDGPVDDPETDEEEEYRMVYDTADGAPLDLDLSLKNIPNGTLSGTLAGKVLVTGDLEGELTLAITFSGTLEEGDGGEVVRTAGSTDVSGTATNGGGGVFEIDTTL